MAKDKIKFFSKLLLPELLFGLVAAAGIGIICFFGQTASEHALKFIVMAVFGTAVIGFRIRREFIREDIPYLNRTHMDRFWLGMLISLVLAFACVFLPKEGWPFLAVFVMLSLYSTPTIGITASAVLLMIPAMLAGATIDVYFLYLLSGMFAVCLLCPLEADDKVLLPLILSMLCLLLCETANIILMANARPKLEMFVVPMVNIIISAVLLTGILKLFSSQVVYWFREKYLELNDTENPILVELRESDRETYMKAIHITYFCERLAARLDLDVNAVKCASYYHVLGEEILTIMEEKEFPPRAKELLAEYFTYRQNEKKNPLKHKEIAVIYCSNVVIETVYPLAVGEGTPDYDKIIDSLFQGFMDRGMFDDCDITLRELWALQNIYKEEKLYYDFFR